jgi:hypothetical protein
MVFVPPIQGRAKRKRCWRLPARCSGRERWRTRTMSHPKNQSDGPVFTATKDGASLRLSRDPHPDASGYTLVEAPGLLVLFPIERGSSRPSVPLAQVEPSAHSGHDAQLRDAFDALGSRVAPSAWSSSPKPQTELAAGFRSLAAQAPVREDVASLFGGAPFRRQRDPNAVHFHRNEREGRLAFRTERVQRGCCTRLVPRTLGPNSSGAGWAHSAISK